MRDAGTRGSEALHLGLREVDAMRTPDVAVEPAEAVQVLDGRAAEALAAELLLLHGLGEMRVQLQAQLAETENQLAFSRQYYNDAVSQLNTSVSTIPWMFFAGAAGVSKKEFYEAPEGQTAPPTVQF